MTVLAVSRTRRGSVPLVAIAVVLLTLGFAGGVLPARAVAPAVITGSDFPTRTQASAALNGTGPWSRNLASGLPIGAKPSSCRSDRPFKAAAEHRSAHYYGRNRGASRYQGHAEVHVYRFTNSAAARDAMARVKRSVEACPKSIEWVCENCDGIATITRQAAVNRRVGAQSYSWTERRLGMGAERTRLIAARTGRTVVVTGASHFSTPEDLRMPPPVTWKQTRALATLATQKAAP